MIEINLLPGARKKSRSTSGASLDVRALFADFASRLKDPWLAVAVGGLALGLGLTAAMWFFQGRTLSALEEQQRIATQDSTRYAAVLAQRDAAEAQRDSILRQIAVIAAIDGDRFVWPHVMDEVSRALPTYTWLRSLAQSSSAAAVAPEAVASGTIPPVGIRLVAYTVDQQAVTIFMRELEASPFIQNVTIGSSEQVVTDGKEVTQFQLDMQYSKPDSSVIRTVPLSIAVR